MVLQNTGKYKPDTSQNQLAFKLREDNSDLRLRTSLENDATDAMYGFNRITDHQERIGFLINMHSTEIQDEDRRLISAVDYYFIEENGNRFKVSLPFSPYLYILVKKEFMQEVSTYLSKKFGGSISSIEIVAKEDLDLPNHLIGLKQTFLKISFPNTSELKKVKQTIFSAVRKNKERENSKTFYSEMLAESTGGSIRGASNSAKKNTDNLDNIMDIREHDVPYHVRVSINNKIFVGSWYSIQTRGQHGIPVITKRDDLIDRPDMIVLAFDIETTKLPLKFPDASTDQIMMISYMIDGQGYLITNREIISADVDDFEYTPKPEFEGFFTIFNEQDEASLLRKFFEHIMEVRPHIFVTYNGDFFDWPFVETRAGFYNLNMKQEIGFSKNNEGIYSCRTAIHMDCLCWVKRDSYLPVGSQNLKAVAKAKLRYDPVELDPEEMCRLAADEPQVLSNYSVSDAVATYYLYMKYIHTFIFALCTIIPMEPDEVLRKGSGTLCETLLMVEAFHANIVFPNKQETSFNKMTEDGHVLEQETYVGGHVEALESGVFRADVPCRFKMVPAAFDALMGTVEHALKHAIEEEEKIPVETVLNFDEVAADIKAKLRSLRDTPIRIECPIIYHLDVGAMYPNIILTNRLQPSAMVDDATCAACDFNKPGAKCQRKMTWMWRGEIIPASRNEYVRIQHQLETEKFPPKYPGEPQRAFHQLTREERATVEKKRLQEYSRKVYKKTHTTRIEERATTVCQKENSFYVDTVRAFRDRRYEYKALTKKAKKQVAEALEKNDAGEIKSAKNREVLYDSLQIAHKCILNSFYGYVMRKGARWHSMEMAGIVCHTGANIITRAREIIEKVGRPLELDTDGIWCVLPASFPENYVINSTHPGKSKITISYPNAVLNSMVKEYFTNHVYHELTDPKTLSYETRSENSIFFEVDGPYLAMVLPASKEEGKKLKKRYAVFNFDGSLAELKGFEVKRRGELQLIKIFQSSVFEAFLKGKTLEECYSHVAKVADYWLDVLYSKACNMPDSELFELISENRSMSKKLEDYGGQKSTSISTAKRLAEFLGDQMVKDAGLACKFIISKKPEGFPVTDRAVPLAIFQAESSVKRHFLRKWLKDGTLNDVDIREVLDWDYYIERIGSAIQKIITIPAALQGLPNPVPRVQHPDWLHKKILEKNDTLKQRKINELFTYQAKPVVESMPTCSQVMPEDEPTVQDIEDGPKPSKIVVDKQITAKVNKRKRTESPVQDPLTWQDAFGRPPSIGTSRKAFLKWLKYMKKKWAWQRENRLKVINVSHALHDDFGQVEEVAHKRRKGVAPGALSNFLMKTQRTLLDSAWHILQLQETNEPGVLKVHMVVNGEMHQTKLIVPRIFYVNQRTPRDETPNCSFRKCHRILPRAQPVFNLYQYRVDESKFQKHSRQLMKDLCNVNIEGIYETQITPILRVIIELGSVCSVDRNFAKHLVVAGKSNLSTFSLEHLVACPTVNYLPSNYYSRLNQIYLYYHKAPTGSKAMIGLFLSPKKKAEIYVLDGSQNNRMPNLTNLYSAERRARVSKGSPEELLPAKDVSFEVHIETQPLRAYRAIGRALRAYKDEVKGPTVLVVQSLVDIAALKIHIPDMTDFPVIPFPINEVEEDLYLDPFNWQRHSSQTLLKYYLNSGASTSFAVEQARYTKIPICNIPPAVDKSRLFSADVLFARQLMENNFVLWISGSDLTAPDFGTGIFAEDHRNQTEFEDNSNMMINNSGCYTFMSLELDIEGLAVNAMLQSHHVQDAEGTNFAVAFDQMPQSSLEDMVTAVKHSLPSYDESALCSSAFRILRATVNTWLRDVVQHKNAFADLQLVQFYRWVSSPTSLLYDPAIHRTLCKLMKKLFMQLIAEFKRLGSVVINANFNKILICTKKRSLKDGVGYIEFVVRNIRNKEIFHYIELLYRKSSWEYLLWYDPYNFGGIPTKMPENLLSVGENNNLDELFAEQCEAIPDQSSNLSFTSNLKGKKDFSDSKLEQEGTLIDEEKNEENEIRNKTKYSTGKGSVELNFHMVEHLPEMFQNQFRNIIGGYIGLIFDFLSENVGKQNADDLLNNRKLLSSQLSQITQSVPLGTNSFEAAKEYAQHLIKTELTPKLLALVQKLDQKFPKYQIDNNLVPGIKLQEIKPSLEFIKVVTQVLSLDPSISNEIQKLRSFAFQMIGTSAFSNESQFFDPFINILIPEIICDYCNYSHEINVTKEIHKKKTEDGFFVWFCPFCKSNYDMETRIQNTLIDSVHTKLMTYSLQDLICSTCRQIKLDNLSESCECAGKYNLLFQYKEVYQFLSTICNIAYQFNMLLLQELCQNYLKMNYS